MMHFLLATASVLHVNREGELPIDIAQTPAGSSSGSAVAVSARLCPVALGSESDGSCTFPASRAGLYCLKPTLGMTDCTRVTPGGSPYDSLGGFAKTTQDLATITDVLMKGRKFSRHLNTN